MVRARSNVMTELAPVLLRAFAAARADRPRSGDGKARMLAELGLASAPDWTSARDSGLA